MKTIPPIRILQLVPEPLPTHRPDVTALFGKYLPRHGIDSTLVGKEQLNSQASSPSVKADLTFWMRCCKRLLTASKTTYDVIQVRDMVSIGLLALLIARIKGLPFVYWMSFLMSEARVERASARLHKKKSFRNLAVLLKGSLERWVLYKIILPASDHIFVQSEGMRSFVAQQGILRDHMTPVPMAVDTELLSSDKIHPKRLPGWESTKLIAYIGTVEKMRQLHVAIDALAMLRENRPDVRLLLIGSSPTPSDVSDLMDHAHDKGVTDGVHITGWLPTRDALDLLAGADVALSYYPRSEILDTGSPTKLLEYLALAMPCVGNDNPDQVIVLQESGAGILCQSDVRSLCAALAKALDNHTDAVSRAATGPAYIEEKRSYRTLSAEIASVYVTQIVNPC